MTFLSIWSVFAPVVASALMIPNTPPGAELITPIIQESTPTIAIVPAEKLAMASNDGIRDVAPAALGQNSALSKKSLKALVADLATAKTTDAAHDCLAATVYFESRAEPLEGQLAVAEVVINRTKSKRFRRTICDVVKQPKQFSFVRGGAIPYADRSSRSWKRAVAVAKIARENLWSSSASKALYFHADYAKPGWRHRLQHQATLGNHIFYR
jgi:spore germination cell wall hydrolase CwlJ-like protein